MSKHSHDTSDTDNTQKENQWEDITIQKDHQNPSSSEAPWESNDSKENIQTDESLGTDSTNEKKSWRSRCVIRNHPIWVISAIFLIIIIAVIGIYEVRIHRIEERYSWSYAQWNHIMSRYQENRWDSDIFRMHHTMMQDFNMLEQRHYALMNRMFQNMEQPVEKTVTTSNSQYSGYREVNNNFIRYSLENKDGTIKGSVVGSNSGTLSELKIQLEKLGVSWNLQGNTLTFQWPNNNIGAVIKTLDAR